MQGRFAFRQIDIRDFEMFLQDGEIRSKNYKPKQKCHQTSYDQLVDLRSTNTFAIPCGGVVNDYVAFYFSPLTGFTHTIHNGNVDVLSPAEVALGKSRKEDRAFLVFSVPEIFASNLKCCFSNLALNSASASHSITDVKADLPTHVDWKLFDEEPLEAKIPAIGYQGVCRYFMDSPVSGRENRSKKRMAELLVYDAIPMAKAKAIVLPTVAAFKMARSLADKYNFKGKVINDPQCFR